MKTAFGRSAYLLATAIVLALAACMLFSLRVEAEISASRIAIVLGDKSEDLEARVANVLKSRIEKRSDVYIVIANERSFRESENVDLIILLGRAGYHDTISKLCQASDIPLPSDRDPGPEGFIVKTIELRGKPAILAAGVDKRGTLYSVGEILRRLTYNPKSVEIDEVDVRTAPAYRFRGASANQGGTMRRITGARSWTKEELEEYTLDLALAGANIFYAYGGDYYDFVKSFDLLTVGSGFRPNQLPKDYPPEWQSPTERRKGWVCPSIPEAHQALREYWEEKSRNSPDSDILRIYAGDPGGCRCERCMPWGKKFIELSEEIAEIWLRYHPNTLSIQIANQDLTNAGDQAIFDYLNEKPRKWLSAICYGPGSNAMSPYFRSELREDLFIYPGSGPLNRYLREILNQIPKHQYIVHYSDVTHWISSQYQVENPEPHLVSVYGRRTFHTRPRAYYRIFQAIMPFSGGDILYSEGHHDEFHQYMWNRLLWNPNRSLEDVIMEYTMFHFGPEAAKDMMEAMLQLESNLEAPLATNEGIDRYYLLVKEAGWKIPPHLMEGNWRWRLHMQKAALDKYLQLKLRREEERYDRVIALLSKGLASGDIDRAISSASGLLGEDIETPDMIALKEEAGRLGEESEEIFGVRNVGYFNLEGDFAGLRWLSREIGRASSAESTEEKRRILDGVVNYERPGEGSFYDDAGNRDHQPHLRKGRSYNASQWMDPSNRPSQNTIAYSFDDGKGVTFEYDGLDPKASYKLRLTLVAPRREGSGQIPRTQHVVADGYYLARDVEVPLYTAKQVEFDIPRRLTEDGKLEVWFEKGSSGLATIVSEIWLIKK